MACMKVWQTDAADPFRCYLGREVSFRAGPHVVERCEVQGRNLLFRLRSLESGRDSHVTVLELLDLLERPGA